MVTHVINSTQTITYINNTGVIMKRKFSHLNLSISNYREFTSDRNNETEDTPMHSITYVQNGYVVNDLIDDWH